jgi:hypothetical protein
LAADCKEYFKAAMQFVVSPGKFGAWFWFLPPLSLLSAAWKPSWIPTCFRKPIFFACDLNRRRRDVQVCCGSGGQGGYNFNLRLPAVEDWVLDSIPYSVKKHVQQVTGC